ncbi:hypothetical protein PUN28_011453 [Cardiocondyla obscurior]|uniref:Uncharacterized protein n=1 Tax=Cardiocondyla obscurior TaxID=286306 RepID=A0AAW2FHN8_9HYME
MLALVVRSPAICNFSKLDRRPSLKRGPAGPFKKETSRAGVSVAIDTACFRDSFYYSLLLTLPFRSSKNAILSRDFCYFTYSMTNATIVISFSLFFFFFRIIRYTERNI